MSEVNKEEVRELANKISTYIPKELMSSVWQTYKVISGSKEPQPCSCPSSARLWRKAVDTIRDYVRE
jgi:hypothetical protein